MVSAIRHQLPSALPPSRYATAHHVLKRIPKEADLALLPLASLLARIQEIDQTSSGLFFDESQKTDAVEGFLRNRQTSKCLVN